MRRLSADELVALAAELGAQVTGDVSDLVEAQTADAVLDGLSSLLVAIVQRRPFDRRNDAVAVASIDLLARLNGQTLDLSPPEDSKSMLVRIRAGLTTSEVRHWLGRRIAAHPPAAGPRCPTCTMPLREALAAVPAARTVLPTCGGCGHLLIQPFRRRSRQEV